MRTSTVVCTDPSTTLSASAAPGRTLTPLARTLRVGVVVAFVKLSTALPFLGSYGWDRDELYYLQASRHLALGYVDFPFLTAVIGRLAIDVAGPSLVMLRMTAVIAGMLTLVLVTLCTRELGGGIAAQLTAGLAFVFTPYGLGIGAIFHPTMFDLLAWTAFSYVALRILLRPQPRLWPLLGLIAGVGLETKDTIVALLVVFALALLAVGPRHVLRDRRAWIGAAIAVACVLPYVAWEMAHGWPTLAFLPSQDAATAAATPPLTYFAQQPAFLGIVLVLVALGVIELWRNPRLRALALLAPLTSLLFFVEQGRSYYSLPAVTLPLAAGAVAALRRRHSARRGWLAAGLVVIQLATLTLVAPLVWPVIPTATMVRLGIWQTTFYKDEIGWHELVAQVARAWRAIPLAERHDTALLAQNYGEAGALALYGPALGLPQPLSGHLSFQYWHPRHMREHHLLTVGFNASSLTDICATSHVVTHIDNDWHIANEERGGPVLTCTLGRALGQLWATRIASDRL